MKCTHPRLTLVVCLIVIATTVYAVDEPQILLPKHRIGAAELAVIVNDADPLSRQIANYYMQRRGIPKRNLIHVNFEPRRTALTADEFNGIKQDVDAATPPQIQAYALTWAEPYRVGCMSITSAFAFGFDKRWCSAKTCAVTQPSPYFASDSATPFDDFKFRPTMSLAAADFATAKALIDRGIASDGSRPRGTAYLVSTTDKARNVRATTYANIKRLFDPLLTTEVVRHNALIGRDDVMFYFTGRVSVDGLDTLQFLPGAVGDHLTSTGGQLTDSKQMSVLRWLEAGATGSFGTVVEPCAWPSKFPNPGIMMAHYLRGATLIEAYWKSVQMPGEGIFIGEPLAAPFDFRSVERRAGELRLHTWSLRPGLYQLQTAPSPVGPFKSELAYRVDPFPTELRIPDRGAAVYRLTPMPVLGSTPPPPR